MSFVFTCSLPSFNDMSKHSLVFVASFVVVVVGFWVFVVVFFLGGGGGEAGLLCSF